jgi:hypothetical protein
MKYLAFGFVFMFVTMAFVPEAEAVVCARGVHRAGCVAAGGAAVVHRPVVRGCVRVWRHGVHVCR